MLPVLNSGGLQLSFVRYSVVGGAATAVHYGVLMLLVERLGARPAESAAIGAVCGAATAYWGNRRFTFGAVGAHRSSLPRFLAVAALSAALSAGAVSLLSRLGMHYLVSQVLATVVTLLTGYWLNKRWTFVS